MVFVFPLDILLNHVHHHKHNDYKYSFWLSCTSRPSIQWLYDRISCLLLVFTASITSKTHFNLQELNVLGFNKVSVQCFSLSQMSLGHKLSEPSVDYKEGCCLIALYSLPPVLPLCLYFPLQNKSLKFALQNSTCCFSFSLPGNKWSSLAKHFNCTQLTFFPLSIPYCVKRLSSEPL